MLEGNILDDIYLVKQERRSAERRGWPLRLRATDRSRHMGIRVFILPIGVGVPSELRDLAMGTGVQRQGLTFTDGHPLHAVTSQHTTSDGYWYSVTGTGIQRRRLTRTIPLKPQLSTAPVSLIDGTTKLQRLYVSLPLLHLPNLCSVRQIVILGQYAPSIPSRLHTLTV